MAADNPMRWTTKYTDGESGLVYYGYRYYNAGTGRWLSRDPMGTTDTPAEYTSFDNEPISHIDSLGLWGTEVHHQIVEDWLTGIGRNKVLNRMYRHFIWPKSCNCVVDVIALLQEGSDIIDGVDGYSVVDFLMAQGSSTAYAHGMRSPYESVATAQAKYTAFINGNLRAATLDSWRAGVLQDCEGFKNAIREVGMAFHAVSDSFSPSHQGFQVWYGPADTFQYGLDHPTGPDYATYLSVHEIQESLTAFQSLGLNWRRSMLASIRSQLQGTLDRVLLSK